MSTYNIFKELDLTPPMPRQAVIDALDKKVTSLNKLRLKRSDIGPRYEHFKQIKADVDRNPAIIDEHAAAYGRIAEQERREREEQLRRDAAIYVVNGLIEEAQLKKLVAANPGLDEQRILSILGAKVKGKRSFSYTEDPNVRETDPLVMKTVRELLEKVGKKDLYQWLSLSSKADRAQISRVCDDLYLRSQTEGTLEMRTTMSSLVGQAKSLLLDPDRRAGYDKALANAGLAPVREQMKAIAMGSVKVVAPSQYDALLQTCTRAGIPRERAEYYIYKEAEKLGLTVMEDGGETKICRFCGSINPAGASACKTCAMPIVVTCPSCGRQSDNHEELRCMKCGFAIGEMPQAEVNVANAENALRYNNIDDAARYLAAARKQWPGYRSIAPVAEKVERARNAAANAVRDITALVSDKKFYAAAERLSSLPATPEADALRSRVENAVTQADALVRQAETARDPNARLELYLKALATAPDCRAAADKLRMTPPAAPASATAVVRGRNVTISWPRHQSDFINYRIIRKQGARPASATDGTLVGETAASSIDDTTAVPGTCYFYAVYSQCGDIISVAGAVTPSPALVVADIDLDDILAVVEERQIKFSFKLPHGADAIELFRDGAPVKTVTGTSYIDASLTPDRNYCYRFVTVYRDITGKMLCSPGVEMTLAPTAPPRPVELRLSDLGDRVRLTWTPPAKGALTIYVADRPWTYTLNETVSIDRIKSPAVSFTGNMVELRKDFCGIRYCLPVTVVGNMGVAGRPVRVDSIKQPEDVTIDKNDNFVNLRWKWGTTPAVRAEWQIGDGRLVTRDIRSSSPAQLKIDFPASAASIRVSLRSLIETPEGPVTSDPVEKTLSLKAVRVSFSDVRSEAKFGGLFGRDKYSLTLKCDSMLPCSLALLIGEGVIPSDLVNSIPDFTIPANVITPGTAQSFDFTYSRRDKSRPLFFRLVAADRAMASLLSISPESRKIK